MSEDKFRPISVTKTRPLANILHKRLDMRGAAACWQSTAEADDSPPGTRWSVVTAMEMLSNLYFNLQILNV